MTNLQMKIIDLDHPNDYVDIEDLTRTGVEDLIYQTERWLDDLNNVEFKED